MNQSHYQNGNIPSELKWGSPLLGPLRSARFTVARVANSVLGNEWPHAIFPHFSIVGRTIVGDQLDFQAKLTAWTFDLTKSWKSRNQQIGDSSNAS